MRKGKKGKKRKKGTPKTKTKLPNPKKKSKKDKRLLKRKKLPKGQSLQQEKTLLLFDGNGALVHCVRDKKFKLVPGQTTVRPGVVQMLDLIHKLCGRNILFVIQTGARDAKALAAFCKELKDLGLLK